MMHNKQNNNVEASEKLKQAVDHFAHILPAQASIKDFVHHNTLHGFESLKFEDALSAANELTGAYGFWPQEKFREAYLKNRITDDDINFVLEGDKVFDANKVFLRRDAGRVNIKKGDIYRLASIYAFKNITNCQLNWQSEEAHAFEMFQSDVPANVRTQLLDASGQNEKQTINSLWNACIKRLDLDATILHPEELIDLAPEQAQKIFSKLSDQEGFNKISHDDALSDDQKKEQEVQQQAWKTLQHVTAKQPQAIGFNLQALIKTLTGVEVNEAITTTTQSKIDPLIQKQAWRLLGVEIDKIGTEITLRSFLKELTSIDVHDEIIPYLLPYIANWLDEGIAQWHANPQYADDFYKSWKLSAAVDESGIFADIPDWKEHIESLPESSIDTVIAELKRMSIPEDKWDAYISRLALDLPGWSGMFYWRHSKPGYKTKRSDKRSSESSHQQHIEMMDYLAVRIVLEHLFVRKLCRKLWLIEGNVETIRGYLHLQDAEFYVRYALYNLHLPEYIKSRAHYLVSLTANRESLRTHTKEWQEFAQLIWTWQKGPSSDSLSEQRTGHETCNKARGATLQQDGWVLFRLAQHLALTADEINSLSDAQLNTVFECIQLMRDETRGFVLLKAYERHYRDEVFSVVVKNHGRGTWANRDDTPEAQLIFCMDDREEGIRRHLEHHNPAIETLGAAAFFGVAMNWKGLHDDDSVVLCPIVIDPVHDVLEVADDRHIEDVQKNQKRVNLRQRVGNFIHQDTHRSLFPTTFLMLVYLPLALVTLVGKIFKPLSWSKAVLGLQSRFDQESITRITTTYADEGGGASKQHKTKNSPQQGYSIDEQTLIVKAFLENNGLLSGFAPLVVLIGHYSKNQNNPHAAAYGCGACGGKFSGPNGRVFASMANNPEVRKHLKSGGVCLPENCWFIGAEHDTCNESIKWEDIDLIPETLRPNFDQLHREFELASQHSARERCRKLASAPANPSLSTASKHIAARAVDFSQARPELGHATIAVGFVGRRHLSQGTFMDRRSFLISYDASVDPDGVFLERILLSAGPVGAGINLEYYFSSVNNDHYGCGSKIVHNVSGLFGVMEGTAGDLRTGLPKQMIEIHEPMRLQLMVEVKKEVLSAIYTRQESIQQLVGNGWLLLSAKNPESAEIHTFDPENGWQLWQDPKTREVITVKDSQAWYQGSHDHLSPVLIETVKNSTKNKASHA